MRLSALGLVLVLTFSGGYAEAAKRLGGGKSIGKQSSNVTQRDGAPAAPAAAPQGTNNAATAVAPKPAPAPTPAPQRPWGAMLGGLAAGLGLAWLASSLGLGEAFGQIVLWGIFAMLALAVVGWFLRRRAAAPKSAGWAMQGAGGPALVTRPMLYSPENVGNDASARPWERAGVAFQSSAPGALGGSLIGSALSGAQSWSVPDDFDTPGFLQAAKANFIALQAAWDRSDVAALRAMMTDAMLGEITSQLAERETHTGSDANLTEVVMLDARLLGIENLSEGYMASVEFSGVIREEPAASPSPFREVWNLTKLREGRSGWLVAGVQALQ